MPAGCPRLTTGGGVGWEIVGATASPDAAWAVLAHLTSPESVAQMSVIWYPGRKSALARLMALDPELPPASRWVGAEGQQLIHPDPIFPAWGQIERELIAPELERLWSGERTARQIVGSLVPRVNAFLQGLAKP